MIALRSRCYHVAVTVWSRCGYGAVTVWSRCGHGVVTVTAVPGGAAESLIVEEGGARGSQLESRPREPTVTARSRRDQGTGESGRNFQGLRDGGCEAVALLGSCRGG